MAPRRRITRIVIRQGFPPSGPDDLEAIVVNVSREDYDRAGAWTVTLPAELDQPSDFELEPSGDASRQAAREPLACDGVQRGRGRGSSLLSPRARSHRDDRHPRPPPEVTLSYALKRPWLPGRPWSLFVKTEPPGATVPPLVLIANPRAIPLSADDGDVVARWPASKDGAIHVIRTREGGRSGVRASLDPTRNRIRCRRSASAIPSPASRRV